MKRILAIVFAAIATPALAHTGVGDTTSFAHGFLHPLGGQDHVLAMVAVGLLAALMGDRALWLLPLSFVTMMAGGAALALDGARLALAEMGIAASVVALGAAIAFRRNMPVALAMAFVGFFAIFHGHAHGTEMPNTASGFAYGAGFVLATALLHACGIGLGSGLGTLADHRGRRIAQLAGGAMALAGVAILSGML
jgi:urease accessory protein